MTRAPKNIPLDGETINMLRTVCVAGRVRSAFNGDSNARIEQLVAAGFLAVVSVPASDPNAIRPQRSYRPTQSGRELLHELEKGAA
jgi:hypothetical protein